MPYALQQLAPGSYDLLLDGQLIGGVVRNVGDRTGGWQAELLGDVLRAKRPPPFTELEHWLPSWEALLAWLDQPVIQSNGNNS